MPPLQTVNLYRVDVLKTGRFNGRLYTLADLDSIVESFQYLKGQYDPPAKLGHSEDQPVAERDGIPTPSDSEPSFGWPSRLYRVGNTLYADFQKVPKRFAELVKAGAWPKRSCEVWFGSVWNGRKLPVVLKAVSFLGGTPPAVGGLSDIEAYYNSQHDQQPALATLAQSAEATETVEHLADEAPFKTDGGTKFHAEDYAYVPDANDPATWKLRFVATPGGSPDAGLVGNCIAALSPGGFRGNQADIPDADKPKVRGRLRSLWKQANPDKPEDQMPDTIKNARKGRRAVRADLAATASGYKQLQQVLQDALDTAYPPADPEQVDASQDGPSNTLVEFDDDSVWVTDVDGDAFWRLPYTLGADGSAQLGTPVAQVLTDAPAGTNPDQEPDEDDTPENQEPGETAQMARLAAGANPVDPEKARTKLLAAIDDWLTAATALTAGVKGAPALRVMAKELRTKLAALKLPAVQQPAPVQNSRQEDDEMALRDELRRTLRLAAEATDEDIMTAVLASQAGRVDLAEYEQLSQTVQNMQRRDEERAAGELVQLALKDGKIRASDEAKAWALEEAMQNPDRFKRYLEITPKHSVMKLAEISGSDADLRDEAHVQEEESVAAGAARIGMTAERYRELNRPLPELLAEQQRQATSTGSR